MSGEEKTFALGFDMLHLCPCTPKIVSTAPGGTCLTLSEIAEISKSAEPGSEFGF